MQPDKTILIEPTIENSFSIERYENLLIDKKRCRLNYHRIQYIENGQGILNIDGKSFEVKGDEVFLLSKGQIYSFDNSSIITGYTISFGDCFWERTPQSASNCKAVLFNNTAAHHNLQLNNLEKTHLLFLFKILFKEYKGPHYINQQDVLAAYLKIIMIKLANLKTTNESTFDSQDYLLYRQFMELLSTNYYQYHAVNNYADILNITSRRLSEICKRCSGLKAKEIINGQIIAEAKRCLQFSSTTIKEIAYALNFNTAEQFSHFFKKNTSQSPVDYRQHFIDMGL